MEISFQKFIEELSKKQFILLGELHGTKEIPEVVNNIIKNLLYELDFLFLEIPIDQQVYLDKYIKSRDENDLISIPFFKNPQKDGRDSIDNLLLIKNVINSSNKIKIIFVDPDTPKNRDYLMYECIKNNLKANSLSIFFCGNIHASKENMIINGDKLETCGHYLKKLFGNSLYSVNFLPNEGSFYNLEIKNIKNKNKQAGIFVSDGKYYDFEYIIDQVSQCDFL